MQLVLFLICLVCGCLLCARIFIFGQYSYVIRLKHFFLIEHMTNAHTIDVVS